MTRQGDWPKWLGNEEHQGGRRSVLAANPPDEVPKRRFIEPATLTPRKDRNAAISEAGDLGDRAVFAQAYAVAEVRAGGLGAFGPIRAIHVDR